MSPHNVKKIVKKCSSIQFCLKIATEVLQRTLKDNIEYHISYERSIGVVI